MTPADLAQIHAEAFTIPRPWDAVEFSSLLKMPGVFLLSRERGFVLGRVVIDEAELLTIAVPLEQRRKGIGSWLLQSFDQKAADLGAKMGFLEVAANNQAAVSLYKRCGWHMAGRRTGYYRDTSGTIDALIFKRQFVEI